MYISGLRDDGTAQSTEVMILLEPRAEQAQQAKAVITEICLEIS